MKSIQRCRYVLVILSVAAAAPAGAQVSLEQQERTLDVAVEVWRSNGEEPVIENQQSDSAAAPDFGPFSKALDVSYDQSVNNSGTSHGYASQTSTISPTHFEGTGGISVYAETDYAGSSGMGSSTYNVTFRADTPQQYLLNYDFNESPTAYGDSLGSNLRVVRLDAAGGSTTVVEAADLDPRRAETPAPLSGVLPAGRYRFEFSTGQDSDIGSSYNYAFQFDLAAVPEPAGAGLALVGAGLALLRRRHRVCSNV
jgi:hypothetical protein